MKLINQHKILFLMGDIFCTDMNYCTAELNIHYYGYLTFISINTPHKGIEPGFFSLSIE